jgi:hypothetical protein
MTLLQPYGNHWFLHNIKALINLIFLAREASKRLSFPRKLRDHRYLLRGIKVHLDRHRTKVQLKIQCHAQVQIVHRFWKGEKTHRWGCAFSFTTAYLQHNTYTQVVQQKSYPLGCSVCKRSPDIAITYKALWNSIKFLTNWLPWPTNAVLPPLQSPRFSLKNWGWKLKSMQDSRRNPRGTRYDKNCAG